jgi:hypothetical protein
LTQQLSASTMLDLLPRNGAIPSRANLREAIHPTSPPMEIPTDLTNDQLSYRFRPYLWQI